jgi:hypothetical protein
MLAEVSGGPAACNVLTFRSFREVKAVAKRRFVGVWISVVAERFRE